MHMSRLHSFLHSRCNVLQCKSTNAIMCAGAGGIVNKSQKVHFLPARARVCVCVCARVRACVCARARVCVCMRARVCHLAVVRLFLYKDSRRCVSPTSITTC